MVSLSYNEIDERRREDACVLERQGVLKRSVNTPEVMYYNLLHAIQQISGVTPSTPGTPGAAVEVVGLKNGADARIDPATEGTATAIKDLIGALSDGPDASGTLLARLAEIAQNTATRQQDPELIEYQVATNGDWLLGYTTVSGAGVMEFKDAAGNAIAPVATRITQASSGSAGAAPRIDSRYYTATADAAGVATGDRLRRVMITNPDATPIAVTTAWENLTQGGILANPPANPDEDGDELEGLLKSMLARLGGAPTAADASGTISEQLRAIAEAKSGFLPATYTDVSTGQPDQRGAWDILGGQVYPEGSSTPLAVPAAASNVELLSAGSGASVTQYQETATVGTTPTGIFSLAKDATNTARTLLVDTAQRLLVSNPQLNNLFGDLTDPASATGGLLSRVGHLAGRLSSIQGLMGDAADAPTENTVIGLLKRIAGGIEGRVDAEPVEYQATSASDPWQVGYAIRAAGGALDFYSAAGAQITPFNVRLTQGSTIDSASNQASVANRYYLATQDSPGVTTGDRLRRVILTTFGTPNSVSEIWHNLDTGAVLTDDPVSPDDLGDEVESLLRSLGTSITTILSRVGIGTDPASATGTIQQQLRAIAEATESQKIFPVIAQHSLRPLQTATTAAVTMPAVGQPVTIPVGATAGFEVGDRVLLAQEENGEIARRAYLEVTGVSGSDITATRLASPDAKDRDGEEFGVDSELTGQLRMPAAPAGQTVKKVEITATMPTQVYEDFSTNQVAEWVLQNTLPLAYFGLKEGQDIDLVNRMGQPLRESGFVELSEPTDLGRVRLVGSVPIRYAPFFDVIYRGGV